MTLNVDGYIPPLKSPSSIRLVSFNINGFKTLNHYHPWNDLNSLENIFNYLNCDIISFQELKLQKSDITRSIAVVKNFNTFITIPKFKKGYSGVSIFIKSSNNNNNLKILKIEEGITGYLKTYFNKDLNYRDNFKLNGEFNSNSIGGYTDNLINDLNNALLIDQDGRCLIVELNNNLIIIAVYCPANSLLDENIENLRCLFLETLFKRVENLKKLGKNIIIMGDINICPSLIDNDDSINKGLNNNSLILPSKTQSTDNWFEKLNKNSVLKFKSETLPRQILNDYLYDFNEFNEFENNSKILFDLGRLKNLNKLKFYTCWNTLKNNRPLNIGSRIDLFLSTKDVKDACDDCNIWSFLYGSDHCPIYLDIDLNKLPKSESNVSFKPNVKKFEAVNYYDLTITKSIDSFFKSNRKVNNDENNNNKKNNKNKETKRSLTVPVYTSRKKQKGQSTLSSLITSKSSSQSQSNSDTKLESQSKSQISHCEDSLFVQDSDDDDDNYNNNNTNNTDSNRIIMEKPKLSANTFNELLTMKSFNSVPQCQHGEPCVLRTTKKGANAGKKFWCCSKPSRTSTWREQDEGGSNNNDTKIDGNNRDNDYSCSFFKWAQK